MIRHIVMWKFRENAEEEAEHFLSELAALKNQIPYIRSMRVTRSCVENAEFDAVLEAEFDTLEDVHRYKIDPRHKAVSSFCSQIRTIRAAIDIEL